MTTLEFFCNRLSIVALMEMSTYLSDPTEKKPGSEEPEVITKSSAPNSSSRKLPASGSSKEEGSSEGGGGGGGGGGKNEAVATGKVTGLKGRGKSRVVFELRMAMERARVFCNLEDGSQLAMLEQEFMAVNVKVGLGFIRYMVV